MARFRRGFIVGLLVATSLHIDGKSLPHLD